MASNSSHSSPSPPAVPLGTQQGDSHRPSVPSGLRQAQLPPESPEDHYFHQRDDELASSDIQAVDSDINDTDRHHQSFGQVNWSGSNTGSTERLHEAEHVPDVRTKLLGDRNGYKYARDCGQDDCDHGTFSPRPRQQKGYGSIASDYNGPDISGEERSRDAYGGNLPNEPADTDNMSIRNYLLDGSLTKAVRQRFLRSSTRDTANWLVKKHGLSQDRWLYLLYYLPFTNWIRQYRWPMLQGDFIAALTMASFYIPMALSLASNLAHVPPINGLYTFAINPLIYALLGTCPQMVVGPEAAGSLLTGGVVKEAIKAGTHLENDGAQHAQIAGMVTGLAGTFILAAGLCRLGFLDGVLSRPFLRGFISAIGITIIVDQLIPEMGLNSAAKESAAAQHGSSLDKIMFLFRHGNEAHRLTCAVSFSTIAIVLIMRETKRRLQPRMAWVAYLPDRFLVVVLSAVFAWSFNWESQGLAILGDIRSEGQTFRMHFPFDESNFKHVDDAFTTAFIISLLGFFESSVAAKSLGNSSGKVKKVVNKHGEEVEECDGIRDMNLSANRELVALGVANLAGGLFMALPGFGGYGRSKVNASTGGRTPMSSVFLSLITIICIFFLLPYLYYIPVRWIRIYIESVRRLTTLIARGPFRHDICRGLLPDRRSTRRYSLLLHHWRLH